MIGLDHISVSSTTFAFLPAADSNNDGDNQHQRCCRDSDYQLN